MKKKIAHYLKNELVAVTSVLVAFLALLTQFGVDIDQEQQGALVAFVSVVGGLFARSKVTSQKGLAERDAKVGEYLKTVAANQ